MRLKLQIQGSPTLTELILEGFNVTGQYYRLLRALEGTGDLYLYKYYGNLFISNSATDPGSNIGGLYAGSTYFKRINTFSTADLIFKGHTGAAWSEVARIVNAASPLFKIGLSQLNNNMVLSASGFVNCILGDLSLPDDSSAAAQSHNCRYDHTTDTFEIYDGAAWQPH